MTKRIVPAVVVLAAALPGAAALAGCGSSETAATAGTVPHAAAVQSDPPQAVDKLKPHPRVVDPSAGVATGGHAHVSTAEDVSLPQPVSDAQIRRELAASGIPSGDKASLTQDGLAVAPLGAPQTVTTVIDAANQIARLPYRYGGGHQTFIDTAYDCSASLSYAFAAAGLVSAPMTSGQLESWGKPGPGRWITVFANADHTFMYIAGLRFDTGGLLTDGTRWQGSGRSTAGFVVRHPAGL